MKIKYCQYLLFAFTVLFISASHAQKKPISLFELVSLPAKLRYDFTTFNDEVKKIKSKAEIRRLIRSKKFIAANIVFKINISDTSYTWWTISTKLNREKEDDHIILQSRNNFTLTIYRQSDFKNIFKDTLVLLDTLLLTMNFEDQNYPLTEFAYYSGCNKNRMTLTEKIVVENKITIHASLVEYCNEEPSHFILINQSYPENQLANCKLLFLNPDQKQILFDLAKHLMRTEPGITEKEISANLEAYIYNNELGNVCRPQLNQWVKQQKL